jgi:hypothetical protein
VRIRRGQSDGISSADLLGCVLVRWRNRGPRNAEMVAMFQEEFHKFRKAHHQNGA